MNRSLGVRTKLFLLESDYYEDPQKYFSMTV
jgi:hypothetical protein